MRKQTYCEKYTNRKRAERRAPRPKRRAPRASFPTRAPCAVRPFFASKQASGGIIAVRPYIVQTIWRMKMKIVLVINIRNA